MEGTSAAAVEDTGPPKWLNSKLLENSLRQNFSILSLQVENAVSAGENYATVVYRAHADTTLGPVSLIVKCIPENEFRAKFIQEAELMPKEIRMYSETLPMLRGSLVHPNFPYSYKLSSDVQQEILLLRDMKPFGYRTVNRQLGLDVAHCRLVLTELAYLHGLSAALRIQQPYVFNTEIHSYKDTMYNEESREKSEQALKPTFSALAQAVRDNLPYRFNEIGHLMDKMCEIAFDDLKNDICFAHDKTREKEIENSVLVLNHGDCWSNNVLFKYEDGSDKPLACALLDFQLARCASPALDLQYVLYSSTTQATRRAHMDELLQHYLQEARAAMKLRGVTDPGKYFYNSIQQIKDDMQRFSNFGFLFSCFVLPVVIADKSVAPNLDEMTEDSFLINNESPFAKMYSGPLFVKRFTEFLEDFDDMGYFARRAKEFAQSK